MKAEIRAEIEKERAQKKKDREKEVKGDYILLVCYNTGRI